MEGVECGHNEAEVIGETEIWEDDILYSKEVCHCRECEDQFLYPLAR